MASALDDILQRPQPPPGTRPSPPTMLRRGSMSFSAGPGAPGSQRARSMSMTWSAGPGAPGARPLTARPRLASSANVLENVSRASQQSAGPLADAGRLERLERLSSRSWSPTRPPEMEPSRRGSFKLSSAGVGGGIPPQLPLQVTPAATASQDIDRFTSFAQSHNPRKSKTQSSHTAAKDDDKDSCFAGVVIHGDTLKDRLAHKMRMVEEEQARARRAEYLDKSLADPDAKAGASTKDAKAGPSPQELRSRRHTEPLIQTLSDLQPNLQAFPKSLTQLRTAVASQDGALNNRSHPVPKASTARLSTSKRGSLFRRQSVAEIVAEARVQDLLREHERKEHKDTAQVAANRQNNDWRQSDDTKLTSEQRLQAAASAAAAERLGRIVLFRTCSRSTSPKRTPSMERQQDGAGDISRAPLLPQRGGLNGTASPLGRTPSTDDTALDDANQLDRIAQTDEEYRRQRSLIRKALREFRPSEDDWLDICYIL